MVKWVCCYIGIEPCHDMVDDNYEHNKNQFDHNYAGAHKKTTSEGIYTYL